MQGLESRPLFCAPQTAEFIQRNRNFIRARWLEWDRYAEREKFLNGPLKEFPAEFLAALEDSLRSSSITLPWSYLRGLLLHLPVSALLRELQYLRNSILAIFDAENSQEKAEFVPILRIFDAASNQLVDVSIEEDLRLSKEAVQLATEIARMGIWDFDIVADRVEMSDRTKEIVGVGKDCTLTLMQVMQDHVHPDDREVVESGLQQAFDPKGDGRYTSTVRLCIPGREDRYVYSIAQTFFVGDGETRRPVRLLGTLLDVTEERRMQNALQTAKEAAESASATKSAFLANMSHEIRTPLSAILGFTDLLLGGRGTPEKQQRYLETIERNGRGLMFIIDDILDLSKVEAGRLDLETVSFSLKSLLSEVIDLFQEKAQLKNIFLRLKIDENVPEHISSDPTRIRQILVNLLSNAVKFTDRGAVEVELACAALKTGKCQLTFVVSDSGVGLTQEQQQRLFRAFSQADNSTTRRFGGTGLGLYLAKRLAQALGGDIYLRESAVNAGCTFVFDFVSEVSMLISKPEHNDRSEAIPANRPPLSEVRILVAEDAFDNQLLIRTILSSCGAEVEVANNGGEAVDAAMRKSFDVILMDLQMPVMDGYEATRTLRKSGYSKPIIALTAHAMMEERVRTREAGCNYHLTKPLNVPELIETIKRSIGEQTPK